MPLEDDLDLHEPLENDRVICDYCTRDVFRAALWDHLKNYHRYFSHLHITTIGFNDRFFQWDDSGRVQRPRWTRRWSWSGQSIWSCNVSASWINYSHHLNNVLNQIGPENFLMFRLWQELTGTSRLLIQLVLNSKFIVIPWLHWSGVFTIQDKCRMCKVMREKKQWAKLNKWYSNLGIF